MRPEDPRDEIHLLAIERVEAFGNALHGNPKISAAEATHHTDNAYLLVEYLANAYPKLPRDATERDVWLFLFDYYLTAGPFAGAATQVAPASTRLFFEFVARSERVREIKYIRAACEQESLYASRKKQYEAFARGGGSEIAIQAWYEDLDHQMRRRGLIPDASLDGGEPTWAVEMGPVEAAVFDAVCFYLAEKARQLEPRRPTDDERERALLQTQRAFMQTPNAQLRATPLEAIVRERAARSNEDGASH